MIHTYAVVGLGYVGLGLATALAKHEQVMGTTSIKKEFKAYETMWIKIN